MPEKPENDSPLSETAENVLKALEANPSWHMAAEIADEVNRASSTVKGVLKTLEKKGLVVLTHSDNLLLARINDGQDLPPLAAKEIELLRLIEYKAKQGEAVKLTPGGVAMTAYALQTKKLVTIAPDGGSVTLRKRD